MKNIINNEQMISISDLKKQAKIARKKNNELSNHSESLKAIANEYNYDSWEKLLDASYLIIEKKTEPFYSIEQEHLHWENCLFFTFLSKFVNTMNFCHEEYEFLNNRAGYNTLFNFFQENILKNHEVTSPIYQKLKLLIDFMISSFLEYNKEYRKFNNILSFATLNKENPFFNENLSENLSKKLRKYIKFNNLHINGIPESNMIKIEDTLYMENIYNHNEVLLILNSINEKINMMATIYDVIENNKKDNNHLNDWLSEYENFISLGSYAIWLTNDIKEYQISLHKYTGSFFNIERHKKALEYLSYYLNNKIGKIKITGTSSEVISNVANEMKDIMDNN